MYTASDFTADNVQSCTISHIPGIKKEPAELLCLHKMAAEMNVQKIDTHTYKELFADALKEWKKRTKQEEIYPSDVSYTLLEMQAMLVDMLNYYSEQVQESHNRY